LFGTALRVGSQNAATGIKKSECSTATYPGRGAEALILSTRCDNGGARVSVCLESNLQLQALQQRFADCCAAAPAPVYWSAFVSHSIDRSKHGQSKD